MEKQGEKIIYGTNRRQITKRQKTNYTIITFYVNKEPTIWHLQNMYFNFKNIDKSKVKEKINIRKKYFMVISINRDKREHFIMLKESIHQEDTTISR